MSGHWASVLGALVPLALVVALSPVSIIPAVLLVLQTARPRPTGLAFLLGWLVGLAVLTALFVQLPRLLGDSDHAPRPWVSWVRIAIGVALIALGAYQWAMRRRTTRSPGWLAWISAITPARAGVLALILAVANPKVLFMCAAAGVVIGTAGFGKPGIWIAVGYFVVLAGSTAALPILAYAIAPQRLDRPLERVRVWIQRQHAALAAVIVAVIGVVLLYSGFERLVSR